MKAVKFIAVSACALSLALASCSAPKKVLYLPEAENIPVELLSKTDRGLNPTLSAGDLLNIRVFGPDMTAVAPFNKGQYVTPDGQIAGSSANTNTGNGSETSTDFYLVNPQGYIEMPILGEIKATGKTKQQLADEIKDLIYPKYVTTPPTVEIRLMNFKVTVLGQVHSPGQYISKNERMNILEAIAMAGDLDIKGDRETIMLYRTNPDGTREIHRLNLHDRNLLLSPYFNLQQNDFIYVEPNRSARANAWQMHQGFSTAMTVVGGLSSIAGLVISIITLTKL